MECGLSSNPAAAFGSMNAATANGNINGSGSPTSANTKSNKDQQHVNFQLDSKDKQDRQKYLTAKYGPHQMNLIRKRLAVEYWLYDQLLFIFDDKDCDVELDLDELLDIDGDLGKRVWVQEKLINAKRPQDIVQKFIEELLARAKTL
ncbi:hypothetical protein CHUAL_004210 [Chamberlinius hualienensis]